MSEKSIGTRWRVSRRRWRFSLSEPYWVTPEQLIDVNVDIVADTREQHGILKPNELESACWRPYNLWNYGEEESVAALAVALLAGIVQNHPFIEGNKRTGLIACRTLLINNGYDIDMPDEDLGPLIRDFAAGHLEESDLVDAIEANLVSID